MKDAYSSIFNAHTGKVSDKWSSYLPFYDEHFAPYIEGGRAILEIGVQNGGSLEILAKLFKNAELILGIDIDPKCGELLFDDPRIKAIVGDATAQETVERVAALAETFDVIVDDGSHTSRDIIGAIFRYFPLVKPGGLMVLEDLHCSYWSSHGGQLFSPDSAQAFLQRLSDVMNLEHFQQADSLSLLFSHHAKLVGVTDVSEALTEISRITFENSMVAIYRSPCGRPTLGRRNVVGADGSVIDLVKSFNGQSCFPPANASITPALTSEFLTHLNMEQNQELFNLRTSSAALESKFSGIISKLDEAGQQADHRETRWIDALTEIDRRSKESADQTAEVSRIAVVLEQERSAHAQLSVQIQAKVEQIERVETEITNLLSALASSETVNEKLVGVVASLQARLTSTTDAFAAASLECTRLEAQKETSSRMLVESQLSVSAMSRKLSVITTSRLYRFFSAMGLLNRG
jgi:23S rRNA U2552 (ribose-2'-O)-methylase RlmE/FtsJ